MSLYLKYRPQNFSSVVGQEHAVKTIQNAIKNGNPAHAYLFAGSRGTGKTSLARIVAKALNCTKSGESKEPCNQCEICEAINNNKLVDLIEIDAASNRGIDEIRELREKIVFAPSQAFCKVYIIDEVHMLTKEAFNALLKTLEEPPAHAYFILATTEAHKIPETIISRCQHFQFKRIGVSEISNRLKFIAEQEGVKTDNGSLNLIAKMANGGLRDAISMFQQMINNNEVSLEKVSENLGLSSEMTVETFFEHLLKKEALAAIEVVHKMNEEGKNLHQFATELISFLREQMLIGLNDKKDLNEIIQLIEIFQKAKEQISQAIIPQLPLEIAIIRACNYEAVQSSKPKEEIKEMEEGAEKTPLKEAGDEESLSLDYIQKNWQKVLNEITTPFVRVSLMDGIVKQYESGEILMEFNSSTMMDKVEKSSNKKEVLNALNSVFGRPLKLRLEVKKINLKAINEKGDKEASVIEMAKEVFGG